MRWLKVSGVIFGAVVITALGIDAADTLQGKSGTMLGQLAGSGGGVCPAGMIEVATGVTFRCVDQYEVSPGKDCPRRNPGNEFDSAVNITEPDCVGVSVAGELPWRYIDREQAQLACLRSGKRLPTNEEWQLLAAGTNDRDCNIDSGNVAEAGASATCQSVVGVFDAVGNVWEWTSEDVFDGTYNNRSLPTEGYVVQVDRGGVATMSSTTSDQNFNQDYFWSKPEGVYGMMRGGFYGSQSDAGVYATHAATVPTMKGVAIGFRCVL